MNPFPPYINPSRRNRAGSFFTMLLFIMMLVSSALMYYYFQRARSLERQVVALQNGELPGNDSESGFLGMLGLGEKRSSPTQDAVTQPVVATPAPEPPTDLTAKQSLPSSGAASTPTPHPENSAESSNLLPSEESNTTKSLLLESDEAALEQEDEPRTTEESPETSEDPPAEQRNLESLYDAQPPVRVRAPQRNNR